VFVAQLTGRCGATETQIQKRDLGHPHFNSSDLGRPPKKFDLIS